MPLLTGKVLLLNSNMSAPRSSPKNSLLKDMQNLKVGGGLPSVAPAPAPAPAKNVTVARRRLSVMASDKKTSPTQLDGVVDAAKLKEKEQQKEKQLPRALSQSKAMKEKKEKTEEGKNDSAEKVRPTFTRYASLSKAGVVYSNAHKINQDSAVEVISFAGDDRKAFFGVFDGHGAVGHDVSGYVASQLPYYIVRQPTLNAQPDVALANAFVECNKDLSYEPTIDCKFSGSTATTVYLTGTDLITANVGDSRVVLGKKNKDGSYKAVGLTNDQKPSVEEEKKRILACGGRVAACKGALGEDIGPLRVWLGHQEVPGLAMTRAFGDSVAATVGVVAHPEVLRFRFEADDAFLILGSDGIWEFITNEEAVQIVAKCKTPEEACRVLVDEATQRWMQNEEVIDDITVIVIFF